MSDAGSDQSRRPGIPKANSILQIAKASGGRQNPAVWRESCAAIGQESRGKPSGRIEDNVGADGPGRDIPQLDGVISLKRCQYSAVRRELHTMSLGGEYGVRLMTEIPPT